MPEQHTDSSTGKVSRDDGFAAWLAMNDYLLDCEFLAGDVPGMPDDPYTEEGLRIAEAEALRRFSSIPDVLAAENRHMFDKFVRFIGETFVRGLGGHWTNKPLVDDGKAYVGVGFPWRETTLEIPTMVTSAVARRTGDEWSFVYRMARKQRDAATRT
jgi:hypothetical protein